MSRSQQRESTFTFYPIEVLFWIPEKKELHQLGSNALVSVEKNSRGLKIPEMEIVEAFKVNLLVEYNGNRILAAVNGSFIVIRNGERVANIHVIPANTCRNHKLYFLNGQLCCTGYKDKSGRCLKEGFIRNKESNEANSIPEVMDDHVVPDKQNGTDKNSNSEYNLVSNSDERKHEQLDKVLKEPKQEHYSQEDLQFSSWLNLPNWRNTFVRDGASDLFELNLLVQKVEYSECTKSSSVICSPILFYPLPIVGCRYVMYIMRREGKALISSDFVAAALRKSKVIKGMRIKSRFPETFLLEQAKPGSYTVVSPLLNLPVDVVICHYEQYHAGHRGCFASGYPYFLCGLTKPSVYEILMRAELNQRNCYLLFEDSPRRSSSIKFRITISRSYSGDCQGPENHLSDLAVLPGPRSGVPPVPAVPICYLRNPLNSPIPAAYPMSIADWLISRAKLDESKEQCSIATESRPLKSEISKQPSKALLLRSIEVFLHNAEFSKHIELTEISDVASETPQKPSFRSHAKPTRKKSIINNSTSKYEAQRFRLILKYTPELALSEQAWFSICPEEIARHIGCRLSKLSQKLGRPLRLLEPFCGAGGNAVHCARLPHIEHVYACDIDPTETDCARRLAQLYGVDKKLTIETKDCLTLRPELFSTKIDAIVFSPPWGGPEYLKSPVYNLQSIQKPAPYNSILFYLSKFTKNIAVLMPRNSCLDQFIPSALSIGSSRLELEQNVLGNIVKTVTIYYNHLAN